MIRNPIPFLLCLLVLSYGYCGVAATVIAAGHTLSPAVIDMDVLPRDIVTHTIVLENTSGVPVTLFPSINNVTSGIEGGKQQFVPPSMSDRTTSLASWMEIGRSGVDLAAGERKEIPLTIRVVPEAKPGAYHAMIAYAPGTTVNDAMRVIEQGGVPITFINATVIEEKNEWMNLSRFMVKKFITTSRDTDAQYRVENSGDTELIPSGDILIYNQVGEEVASIPVNPERQSVKPGETTLFSTALNVDSLLGKYKAFLTLRYGENQAAVYDTVFFYAFPWKKVALAFGIFVGFALALSLLLHYRYEKRRRREEDEEPEDVHALQYDDPVAVPLAIRDTRSRSHHKDVVMKK